MCFVYIAYIYMQIYLYIELYKEMISNGGRDDGKSEVSSVYPPPHYSKGTHTFTRCPSFWQIITYILITSQIIIYFICIHQNLQQTGYQWPITIIYLSLLLAMTLTTIICSCSDPTDQTIYHYKWHKYNQHNRIPPKKQFHLQYETQLYCEYCQSFCSIKSKHCRTCDRCVKNFDHHCIWINNCIGERNYRWFMAMIVCTFLHLVGFVVFGGIFTGVGVEGGVEGRLGYLVPVWIMMVVESVLAVMVLGLVVLHFYLIIQNKTTYEYLQERLMRKRSQQQAKLHKNKNQNLNINIRQLQSDAQINNNKIAQQPTTIRIQQNTSQRNNKKYPKTKQIFDNDNDNDIYNSNDIQKQSNTNNKYYHQNNYRKPPKNKDRSRTTNYSHDNNDNPLQFEYQTRQTQVKSQNLVISKKQISPHKNEGRDYFIGIVDAENPMKSRETMKLYL